MVKILLGVMVLLCVISAIRVVLGDYEQENIELVRKALDSDED